MHDETYCMVVKRNFVLNSQKENNFNPGITEQFSPRMTFFGFTKED